MGADSSVEEKKAPNLPSMRAGDHAVLGVSQHIGGGADDRISRIEDQIKQLVESMRWQQQQQQLLAQQQQQQQPPLRAEYSKATTAANGQLFALSSHPTTPGQGEYSVANSMPPPPRVPPPHRRSYGKPSTPAAYMYTPPPQSRVSAAKPATKSAVRGMSSSEDEDEEKDVESDDDEPLPARDKHMEAIRKAVRDTVKTFYGQRAKDILPVNHWVEQVETAFSIHMGERRTGRLDIVRALLAGPALNWMNRAVREMNEQLAAGQRTEPAEWHLVRSAFIDAHLGSSTTETFKAELRALRLGSAACKTPSELNSQFDQTAELAFPGHAGEGLLDGVLGEEYSNIVAASDHTLWSKIVENVSPLTIQEWKAALARYWASKLTIANKNKQLKASGGTRDQPFRGKSWGAKGGGQKRSDTTSQPSIAAMQTEEGGGQEGEPHTVEGEADSQQLSAAAESTSSSGGQRGGRGGRGGAQRGRGGRRGQSGEEQRPRVLKCFVCESTEHLKASCPHRYQPENGQASQ